MDRPPSCPAVHVSFDPGGAAGHCHQGRRGWEGGPRRRLFLIQGRARRRAVVCGQALLTFAMCVARCGRGALVREMNESSTRVYERSGEKLPVQQGRGTAGELKRSGTRGEGEGARFGRHPGRVVWRWAGNGVEGRGGAEKGRRRGGQEQSPRQGARGGERLGNGWGTAGERQGNGWGTAGVRGWREGERGDRGRKRPPLLPVRAAAAVVFCLYGGRAPAGAGGPSRACPPNPVRGARRKAATNRSTVPGPCPPASTTGHRPWR